MFSNVDISLSFRNVLLVILIAAALSISVGHVDAQTSTDSIAGFSEEQDWEINISGTTGTFLVADLEWAIELAGEGPGLNGFERQLTFLGRAEDNLVILDLFLNSIGTNFFVFFYDYQTNTREFRQFEGEYSYGTLEPAPTLMEGYLPAGPIPSYNGEDFVIESMISSVAPNQGTVQIDESTSIMVFPIFNILSTDTLSQFFAIGIDTLTGHTYFLIFFTTESGFLIDLWSGEMVTVEFGAAEVIGENIVVERDENLEDFDESPAPDPQLQ